MCMKIELKLEGIFEVECNIIDSAIINALPKNNKFCIYKVEDVHRYNIICESENIIKNSLSDSEKSIKKSKFNDKKVDERQDVKTIVLLLESPHKDEYDNKNNPIAPAQGKTGRGIDCQIENVIREIIKFHKSALEKGIYRFIICNPIQYQTSMDMFIKQASEKDLLDLTKKSRLDLKKEVWKAIWSKDKIKEDFKKRIELYKPNLIINACTKDLKEDVTKYLKDNKYNNIYLVSHPSSWNPFNIEKA